MKKYLPFLYFFLCSALLLQAQPQIELQEVGSGFFRPVDITNMGDERLFITQQAGLIRILLPESGTVLGTPFLDITDRVNSSGNERGLLGLAFHPDYLNNGYFYVNYTGAGGHTRISRFELNAGNPNQADPDSELILMTVNQPFSNHNAGALEFGPDGYLYITMGDGGSGGDPGNRSQNPLERLGKMLRIDVDNTDAGLNYGIPASNPFVNTADTLSEIWALGLRNPWRFSFDRLTGDMWIGDVGQNAWEEINFQPADSPGGENYGWRCYEGFATFNTSGCGPANAYVAPVMTYQTGVQGCSVTGGFVYRGCAYPEMYGYYLYADYCSGRFWSLFPDGAGGFENTLLADLANNQFVSFGEDAQGELYVAALGQGRIYRVADASGAEYAYEVGSVSTTCEQAADGELFVNWTGDGAEPSMIEWSNGETGALLSEVTQGNYFVEVTGPNGCTWSNIVTVEAGVLPIPMVFFQGDTLVIDQVYETYQWYFNGSPITGGTDAFHIPIFEGIYFLEASVGDCDVYSEEIEVMITDIDGTLPDMHRLLIAPNPFRDVLRIQWELNTPQDVHLEIIDASGAVVWIRDYQPTLFVSEELRLFDGKAGIYFVRIRVGDQQLMRKVIRSSGESR